MEVTDTRGGSTCAADSIRATSATAFIGTTAAAAAVFCPHGAFEHLRLPASRCQTSIAARGPGYAGATSWPLPAAISAPWVRAGSGQRHGAELPSVPIMPGSNVSSTIRTFSDAVQRRRRLTDVKISTRSAGLVIDTVVCHLPNGRPGPVGSGAVSSRSTNSADRGQAFKRLAQYLIPWVWRACHYSAIFLIRPFLRPVDSF